MPVLEESRVVGATLDPREPETQRAIEYAEAGHDQQEAMLELLRSLDATTKALERYTRSRERYRKACHAAGEPPAIKTLAQRFIDPGEAEVRQIIWAAQAAGLNPVIR
jgi:hypothetical protein